MSRPDRSRRAFRGRLAADPDTRRMLLAAVLSAGIFLVMGVYFLIGFGISSTWLQVFPALIAAPLLWGLLAAGIRIRWGWRASGAGAAAVGVYFVIVGAFPLLPLEVLHRALIFGAAGLFIWFGYWSRGLQ